MSNMRNSAHTADGIFSSECLRQAFTHLLQQGITRRMSQGVVDGLESVKIKKNYAQHLIVSLRLGDRMFKAIQALGRLVRAS